MSQARGKTVGVYAGDLLPGTYLRTRTGVQRGEELFCRPDVERPWRSASAQRHASALAVKEQEIEQLLRLCSQLRSELGNARSDARSIEFAVLEQTKVQVQAKDAIIAELRERITTLEKENTATSEQAAQQVRLLTAQHEHSALELKNEARVAAEQLAALTRMHQTHMQDVRDACVREVTLVESRYRARVDELSAELRAAREQMKTAEAHYARQTTEAAGAAARLEADFGDRLRAQQQRLADGQRAGDEQLREARSATVRALAEMRQAREEASLARAERAELLQQNKQWNDHLAAMLDGCYECVVNAVPSAATDGDGTTSQRQACDASCRAHTTVAMTRQLLAPALLADIDARVTAEHILQRAEQLRQMVATLVRMANAATDDAVIDRAPTGSSLPGRRAAASAGAASDAQVAQLTRRQEVLQRAIDETVDMVCGTQVTLNNCIARLYFFSDNLQQAVAHAPHHCPDLGKTAVLTCLLVAHARALWASDAGAMRNAMTLLFGIVRFKMAEYGASECYSDDGSILLAFDDAVAACRFCGDCQEWLLHAPWPKALLQHEYCHEEHDDDGVLLFRGLRVAAAVHSGPVLREPTALVLRGGSYHMRYYGATVAQTVHLAACAQGGQILITRPAWATCLHARAELRALLVRDAGSCPLPACTATGKATTHAAAAAAAAAAATTTAVDGAFAGGTQMVEVLQLCPTTLQRRTFAPVADAHDARPPAALLDAVSTSTTHALAQRCRALGEAAALLRGESATLHDAVEAMLARTRHARVHFHTLSPVAMTDQLNDLYRVLERVVVEMETMRADVQTVARTQLEFDAQLHGVRAYVAQCSAMCEQEDALRAQMERDRLASEKAVQHMRIAHTKEVQNLQRQLHSRDHAERASARLRAH